MTLEPGEEVQGINLLIPADYDIIWSLVVAAIIGFAFMALRLATQTLTGASFSKRPANLSISRP